MKYKNTWLLPFVSSLILGLVIILSLTNPFFGFSAFLEKLANPNFKDCDCLCPWWLFVVLQIAVSLLIVKYFELKKDKNKKNYSLTLVITGFLVWLLHQVIHNIFTANNTFEPSIFCPWLWLIQLVTLLLFFTKKFKISQS